MILSSGEWFETLLKIVLNDDWILSKHFADHRALKSHA